MDIKVSFLSNASGIYDIFLYDKTIDFFKKVNGIQSVPEPQKIKGTECYYSYSRSGCSDQNWDSYLFKIKDLKINNKWEFINKYWKRNFLNFIL